MKNLLGLVLAGLLVLLVTVLLLRPCDFARADRARAEVEVKAIASALTAYRNDYGVYPSGAVADVAAALLGLNSNQVRYIDGVDVTDLGFTDPWQRPYRVVLHGGNPKVFSTGPDGEAGTIDDIVNRESWE